MADSGKRVKMIIDAYEKPDFTSPVKPSYEFQLNPEKYEKFAKPNTKLNTQILSSGESAPTNKPADVEQLKLIFYIDATGSVPGCTDVPANVKALRKLGLDVNGSIHRANYLKVRWGEDFLFPCILKNLKVDFLLFKPDGTPVRAKIEALFEEFIDAATKAKEDNKNSPDMTHVRTVVDGDNLPMMCYQVYGDSKYYIQVAEYNKLKTIQPLIPNTKIVFPRLSHEF
jgi:phage tail protein X